MPVEYKVRRTQTARTSCYRCGDLHEYCGAAGKRRAKAQCSAVNLEYARRKGYDVPDRKRGASASASARHKKKHRKRRASA